MSGAVVATLRISSPSFTYLYQLPSIRSLTFLLLVLHVIVKFNVVTLKASYLLFHRVPSLINEHPRPHGWSLIEPLGYWHPVAERLTTLYSLSLLWSLQYHKVPLFCAASKKNLHPDVNWIGNIPRHWHVRVSNWLTWSGRLKLFAYSVLLLNAV